jgi:class 3 adenylate cyclase/tetratricopeptide (TPR) repeat protein
MPTCASCGQQNPAGARFCNACAAPLAADAPAAREERKLVTVLFADVVGFTARAEAMDPEDVRRFLQPLHARLRAELERRGGTVEKFIGDAVMAIFGAPVAHEDDPERAVRAALAILDALAEAGDAEVRIGITTGEALIALEARPEAGEGIASGDVVNTAARLQTAAPVGAILVDETTYRASERAIEYDEAEPVQAKGKAEPVRAWQALAARTPVGVERPRDAAFVGRAQEHALLRDTLARVLREREPQLVTLVGVPGIGKSRLVFELFQDFQDDPERVLWLHGGSLPYGEGVTFWALGEMVKAHAGILESDTAAQTEEKLHRAVAAVIADAADAARVERHLRPLAGAESEDIGAGDRRNEAFAAWRRFLEALAETQPLVLVFEDLHWADDALLDFTDHLLDWARGVPILVLATARPELLTRRPAWGGGKVNSATLGLSPLSDADTQTLLEELLGRAMLAAENQPDLLDRAGGNPLYAQEFVRMLTDRQTDLTLPESVHGIIAARLDSLPREEKELMQDAAVVGRVFWLGALGSERWRLEEALHSLERKEFVRRERRSSVAGESEYVFSHALVRDVAYSQIPRSRRAAKHRAAAEWIQSLGRPDDHAEMLAHHYVQALEYAEAGGEREEELAGRAAGAFREAGNRAFSLNAYPAAGRYYERALEIGSKAELDEAGRCELLLSLGDAQARAGDMPAAKETFLEAADAARRAGSPDQLARAALGYGGRFVWARAWGDERLVPLLEEALGALPRGDSPLRVRLLARLAAGPLRDTLPPEPRMAMCREAVGIARRLDDPATLAYALDGLYCSNWGPDVLRERLEIAGELIEVAESAGDVERAYAGHDYLFHGFFELGDLPATRREFESKTALAQELGQPAQLWDLAAGRAVLALFEGRFGEAEAATQEALELGRSAQTANAKVAFDLQMYGLRREQGRLGEIADVIERAVEEYPAYPIWRYVRVDVLAALGRREEARRAFEELAAADFEVRVEMQWLASLSLLPEVARYLGDAERAARLYDALLPFGDHNATTPPELCCGSVSRGLGILAATRSDWDAASAHFEEALEMNGRMGTRPWLAHTSYDYAHMLLARDRAGDRERARALAAQASAIAGELGMSALSEQVAELQGREASVR